MANRNNPKLLLTGSLNVGATVGEINQQLKEISKKINKIKISIDIDDKMVSKLNAISNGMKNVKVISDEMNKVLKKEETIIKNLDGSIDKLTVTTKKSGEITYINSKIIDKSKKSKEAEAEATKKLTEAEGQLGKKLQERRKFDSQGNLTGTSGKYGNKYDNTTVNTNKDNKITGSVQKLNPDAQAKDQIKAEQKKNEELKKIVAERAKIRKEMTALDATGKLTGVQKSTVNQYLISSKSLDDLRKANELVKQITTSIDAQTKRQQENNREKVKANELQRKESLRVANLGSKQISVNKKSFSSDLNKEKTNMEAYIRQVYGVNSANIQLQRTFDTAGNAIWKYSAQIKGLKNIENVKGSIDKTTSALYEQSRAVKAIDKDISIMDAFKTAMIKFPIWLGASTAIFGTARALQEMTTVIIEVDTAMTNLKKVMSLDTNFTEVLDSAIDKGKEFGKTITDVLSAYETFARQGYNQKDIGFMSDASLIASNVGEIDTAQAADYLTASIVQFKLETKDAMSVVDAWNNVSNKNATTVEKLAQGHARAAATARSFGLDMHELNGIIGTVTAATKQSGNEVGNFVKNVLPRLLSDDAKGTLDQLGIAMTDKSGEMRKATDIYADVAEQFDNMSRSQRNMVAETLAGKYHISRMTALLSNWDMYEKQLTDSMNSKNSAMNENATYMQSMQAKINLLKQGFQQLSLAIGGAVLSDGFVGLLGVLGGLAKAGTVVAKSIGFLPVLFGGAGAAALVFSGGLRKIVIDSAITKTALSTLGVTATATRTALAFTGLGLGLVAVGFIAEKLIGHFSQLKREQQEAESQAKRYQKASADALMNNSEHVNDLISSYKELNKAQQNGSLNINEQKEYAKVTQELADIYPNLIHHIDSKGKAHLVEADEIENVNKSTLRYIQLQRDAAVLKAPKQLKKEDSNIDGLLKDIEKLEREKDKSIKKVIKGGQVVFFSDEEKANRKQELALLYNELDIANHKLGEGVKKLASNFTNVEIKIDPKIKEQVDRFVDTLDFSKLNADKRNDVAKIISETYGDLSNAFDTKSPEEYNEVITQLFSDLKDVGGESADSFTESIDKSRNYLRYFTDAQIEAVQVNGDMSEVFDAEVESIDGSTDAIKENSEAKWENASASEILYGKTSDQLSQMQQAIQIIELLSTVQDRSTEQQYLWAQATEFLSQMYPQLNGEIDNNIGYIKTQANAYSILNDASSTAANKLIANEFLTSKAVFNGSKEKIANIKEVIRTLELEAQAFTRRSDSLRAQANIEVGDNIAKRMLNQATKIESIKDYKDLLAQIEGNTKELKKATTVKQTSSGKTVDKIIADKNNKNSGSGSSKDKKGKDKSGSDKSKDIYQTDKYKNALANLDLKIEESQARAEKLNKTSKKYREELEKQIKLIKKKQSLSTSEVKALDKEYNALQKTLKTTKDKGKRGEIQNKIDDNRDRYRSIKSDLLSDAKDIASIIQGYASIVETALQSAKEKFVKSLEDNHQKVLTQIEKALETIDKFDMAEFNDNLNDIANTFDVIDKKFKDNVSFEVDTTNARKEFDKLKDIVSSVIKEVENYSNLDIKDSKGLESSIKNQIMLSKDLQTAIDRANDELRNRKLIYKQIEDALENQIKQTEKSFDLQIEAKQKELDLLDEEYAKIDRIQALKEKNDEIDKAKSDKRFEYIGSNGQVELTYNKEQVSQLEKDRDEMLKQYQREDIKKAIQDYIDALEKSKTDTLNALNDQLQRTRDIHQAELDTYELYIDNLNSLLGNLQNNIGQNKDKLQELYDKEIENAEAYWVNLIKAVGDGTKGFKELINTWTYETLKDLGKFGVDLTGQLDNLKKLFEQITSLNKSISSASSGKTPTKTSSSTTTKTNTTPKATVKKHHEGGVVGDNPTPIQNFVNRMFNVKPGEEVIKALKGEVMIPDKNLGNGITNIRNSIASSIKAQPVEQKNYNFHGMVVQADNPQEFLRGIDFLITSQQ